MERKKHQLSEEVVGSTEYRYHAKQMISDLLDC